MAEFDLSLALPLSPSASEWLDTVTRDFDTFLKDHASAEKKASGMALNVAAHYPDKAQLVRAMVDLAVEELTHYREVIRLLLDRGLTPAADVKDPYVNALNKLIRRGTEVYLLDRLLVGAVVERRGAERFGLVAEWAPDPQLRDFYNAIAASEARHWTLFVELAFTHCAFDTQAIWLRFNDLTRAEAEIIDTLPCTARLH